MLMQRFISARSDISALDIIGPDFKKLDIEKSDPVFISTWAGQSITLSHVRSMNCPN